MSKDKIVTLIEALSSDGYEIIKIDKNCKVQQQLFGDTEILLSNKELKNIPSSHVKDIFSKEKTFKLFDILYSVGYGIVKYEFLSENNFEINLVLQTLWF